MKAYDEITMALDDLHDVHIGLATRDYNLSDEQWEEVGGIAYDIRKNVNRMVKNLRETVIKYDRGTHHDG